MEDLYNDLENYDDVDLVNELRTENSELKQKLSQCTSSMESLQKDFDRLSSEFKKLETNYSSLLKIARAEIKRKTDMIASLNIEKDMLVIKASQTTPGFRFQNLVKTEAKLKKKRRIKAGGPKVEQEFIKKDCERPPSSETSSTAPDNVNNMLGKERIIDHTKSSSRITNKEKEVHREATPDRLGDGNRSPGPILDRRVSALAHPQLSKLSSDEEFEDLYSSLEPNPTTFRGPERGRKRGRDDPQDSRPYYTPSSDKPSNYPDPFRERFKKNRNRYSDTDKNMNKDRLYNESDRYASKNKHDVTYRKFSPERRRGYRDYGDDHYPQQRDRHRRLLTPPRERYQHKSRERRPFYERERDEQKQDVHRFNFPDPHATRHKIHDEYDEPQNKRPRVEYGHQKDRRLSEHQYGHEMYPVERICQSPDFSHTEHESSFEPIREIRSTASSILEDPRVNSKKYVKSTEGNKEVLHTVNANNIDLQPVNKSLWNLHGGQDPKALTSKPSEISEELVDEMDIDKPLSIVSMESGEVASETTEDEYSDYRKINEGVGSYYKSDSRKNYNKTIEKKKNIQRSSIDNPPKDIRLESTVQRDTQPARNKLAKSNNRSGIEEPTAMCYKDSNKNATKRATDRNITSKALEISEELVDEIDVDQPLSIVSMESGEVASETTDIYLDECYDYREVNEGVGSNYKSDSRKNYSKTIEKKKVKPRSPIGNSPQDNRLKITEPTDPKPARIKLVKSDNRCGIDEPLGMSSKDSNKNATKARRGSTEKPSILQKLLKSVMDARGSPERDLDLKLSKSTEGKKHKKVSELKSTVKSDKEKPKSMEGKAQKCLSGSTKSDRCENDAPKGTERKGHKSGFELKIPEKSEKEATKNADGSDHKSLTEMKTSFMIEKESSKSTEEKEYNNLLELKTLVQPDNKASKSPEGKDHHTFSKFKASVLAEQDTLKGREGKDRKSSSKLNTLEKSGKQISKTAKGKDQNKICDYKTSDNSGKQPSKSSEGKEHEDFPEYKSSVQPEKETDNNVAIFRDFEHRVFATRHIIEGDLELSDESNDETNTSHKIDEKVEIKKKQKINNKSHRGTSKEKHVESEDTTRKTRSKTEKVRDKNKFSELFGDSSSLITPEELTLATKEAHAVPAECCPPLCEDAQDGIKESPNPKAHAQSVKVRNSISESKEKSGNPTDVDDKHKLKGKESKTRTHNKRHKDTDCVTSDVSKNPKLNACETKDQQGDSTRCRLVSELKLVISSEKLKEMQTAKMASDINKNDSFKQNEQPKESLKSNKRRKEEKRISISESEEYKIIKSNDTLEASSKKSSEMGDNKENASYNDKSERNISSDMAKMFGDTVSSSNISSTETSGVTEDKLQHNGEPKEPSSITKVQGIPNLAPVIDEPGLVKTVVISSGTQPLDTNVQYTPLHALASSTPAKEIPFNNTSSELEPKVNQTACVNVTITSEDSVSQSETDVPDIRINYYRRRRKVLKR